MPQNPKRADPSSDIIAALPVDTFMSSAEHTSRGSSSKDLLSPPQKDDELGRLGGYRVLKELGKGGMGWVFLAEDEGLQRFVALKVMRPDVAGRDGAKERFLREGRSAAKIKHDNVITIYQVGEDRGIPFLALEYLEGMPLDQYLKQSDGLTLAQILQIVRETAQGLQAAHKYGLIHRDIKPANVWLEFSGNTNSVAGAFRVKVLDFGLARQEQEDTHLTQSGAVVGTPAYMSPEQARGQDIDARSDLWSLGVMLYRLCTGEMPFHGPTTLAVLTALAVDDPKPPRAINPKIPAALERIVLLLLEKKPSCRFQSAGNLISTLQAMEVPGIEPLPGAMQVNLTPATDVWDGIDGSDYIDAKGMRSAEFSREPLASTEAPLSLDEAPATRTAPPCRRNTKRHRSAATHPPS